MRGPLLCRMPLRWLGHLLGITPAHSKTTGPEREALARLAKGRQTLVEVGVDEGVNSLNIRRAMPAESALYLVDPYPAGRLGMNFSYLIARREVSKSRNGRAVFLRAYSHEAAGTWEGAPDFVFIDGDHSYECARRDWEDWSAKLIPSGVIALHDSRIPSEGSPAAEPGPAQLVRELTEEMRKLDAARIRSVEVADSLTVFEKRG